MTKDALNLLAVLVLMILGMLFLVWARDNDYIEVPQFTSPVPDNVEN